MMLLEVYIHLQRLTTGLHMRYSGNELLLNSFQAMAPIVNVPGTRQTELPSKCLQRLCTRRRGRADETPRTKQTGNQSAGFTIAVTDDCNREGAGSKQQARTDHGRHEPTRIRHRSALTLQVSQTRRVERTSALSTDTKRPVLVFVFCFDALTFRSRPQASTETGRPRNRGSPKKSGSFPSGLVPQSQ